MIRFALVLLMCVAGVGCVQTPVKPDRAYYAPVSPQQLQQPKPVDGATGERCHPVAVVVRVHVDGVDVQAPEVGRVDRHLTMVRGTMRF